MADLTSALNAQYHSTLQLMHTTSESWLMLKGWGWSPRALQLPLHKSLKAPTGTRTTGLQKGLGWKGP